MARSIFALPVSVEQVAAVTKQMSPADQQRLLNLAPELRQTAMQVPSRTVNEARAAIERVRAEIMRALGDQPIPPTLPFLGDLTLGQYLDFPDEDRARLREELAEIDMDGLDELDVRPDALPAR